MWDLRACRSCLNTESKLEKVPDTLIRMYAGVTGLQFKPGDGYPNYFCVECHTYLKKCLAFRRKSRRAFFALQATLNAKKQITKADVEQVNRKKNNLLSPLNSCQPDRFHCVKIVDNTTKDDIPTLTITAKDFYNQFQQEKKISLEPKVETYKPSYERHICQIIDIKSADVLIEEEAPPSPEINEDPVENEPEIDLDDVFKDLDDKSDDDRLTDVDEKPTEEDTWTPEKELDVVKKKRATKIERAKNLKNKKDILNAARKLENCVLIPQTEEEMKKNCSQRIAEPAFVLARFKCIICVKVFTQVEQLMKHVRVHNKPGMKVACKICSLRVETQDDLLKHEAEEHNFLYDCQICRRIFYSFPEFKLHFEIAEHTFPQTNLCSKPVLTDCYKIVEATHKEMYASLDNYRLPKAKHTCTVCNIKYENSQSFKSHARSHVEPTPKTKQCDICKVWRRNKKSLAMHIRVLHKYKYICKMCPEVFFTMREAGHHTFTHFNPELQCPDCDRKYTKLKLLPHRMESHYSKFYCNHCVACGQSYSSKLKLYQHQLTEHKRIIMSPPVVDEAQNVCSQCQIQFISEKACNKHLVMHRHPGCKDVPLGCTLCRKIYEDEKSYSFHLAICKGISFPTDCPFCNLTLNTKGDFVTHVKGVHPDQAVLDVIAEQKSRYTLCEHCGQTVHRTRMPAHKSMHNKALPDCAKCEKHFTTLDALCGHILYKHTIRPYRCALCPAAYKIRRHAKDHILKTHAPVRPYSCKRCPLKFSHIDYMNEHATKIHNAQPEKEQYKLLTTALCTYPHMRIDISQISQEVIAKVTFKVCDYHERNITVLQNYSNFFLTEPATLDPVYNNTLPQKRKLSNPNAGKKKKKTNDSGEYEDEKLKLEDVTEEVRNASTEEHLTFGDFTFEEVEVGDHTAEEEVKIEGESNVIIDSDYKLGATDDIVLDPGMDYEVIEQNGQQYVIVNNMLYKIEIE